MVPTALLPDTLCRHNTHEAILPFSGQGACDTEQVDWGDSLATSSIVYVRAISTKLWLGREFSVSFQVPLSLFFVFSTSFSVSSSVDVQTAQQCSSGDVDCLGFPCQEGVCNCGVTFPSLGNESQSTNESLSLAALCQAEPVVGAGLACEADTAAPVCFVPVSSLHVDLGQNVSVQTLFADCDGRNTNSSYPPSSSRALDYTKAKRFIFDGAFFFHKATTIHSITNCLVL